VLRRLAEEAAVAKAAEAQQAAVTEPVSREPDHAEAAEAP
jgi:hypothetical protein